MKVGRAGTIRADAVETQETEETFSVHLSTFRGKKKKK